MVQCCCVAALRPHAARNTVPHRQKRTQLDAQLLRAQLDLIIRVQTEDVVWQVWVGACCPRSPVAAAQGHFAAGYRAQTTQYAAARPHGRRIAQVAPGPQPQCGGREL